MIISIIHNNKDYCIDTKDSIDISIPYNFNGAQPNFYDVKTGHAVGVINKVFVSQGKESALSAPSGISYAIPITHALSLLKQHGL